jgi:hypothetical protein
MKLESLLSRARYLALVLPLFALLTTIHAGCTAGIYVPSGEGGDSTGSGIYGQQGSSGSSGKKDSTTCVTYTPYGGYKYGSGSECADSTSGSGDREP